MMNLTSITSSVLLFLTLIGTANSQDYQASDNRDVVFTPATNTDDLIARYSEVHAKPNEYWQLTSEEWERYQLLKTKSPWSVWANDASPLAILGHYAPSVEERRRYARIAAEIDTWRQYRVTEFQTLYDKERKIVHARYVEWMEQRKPTLATIKPYDKLRLFIQFGACDAHCRSLMGRVLKTQAKVDIYISGAKSDEDIFRWAESAGIPVERVRTKEITLNHDNGIFQLVTSGLGIPAAKLPGLFRQVAGGDQVVAI